MPPMMLTDARIKAAAAPKTGIVELWDEKTSGLCLRLMASGRKSWSFRYRPRSSKRLRRITLGSYPSMTLADARAHAERLRVAVREGADPQHDTKTAITAARATEEREELTFEALARKYIETYAKRHKASWSNDDGYLRRHALKNWGQRTASSITRKDVVRLLSDVVETTPTGANRTRSVLAKLFSWAVDEELLSANPVLGVKKPHKESGGRMRILSDDELRLLWFAIGESSVSTNTAAALKVMALLGQRANEVAGMQAAELVHIDLPAEARWEIPAARMKARRPHVVPLPPLAREIILNQLKAEHPNGSVFASRYTSRERLARHSLSQAMGRIIRRLPIDGPDSVLITGLLADLPTPHDLRRTVASRLAEIGILREDRMAVLAHSHGDIHEAHYDRYDRLREKRAALEAWETHVRRVIGRHVESPVLRAVGA